MIEKPAKCKDCKNFVKSGISAARSGTCKIKTSSLIGNNRLACEEFDGIVEIETEYMKESISYWIEKSKSK